MKDRRVYHVETSERVCGDGQGVELWRKPRNFEFFFTGRGGAPAPATYAEAERFISTHASHAVWMAQCGIAGPSRTTTCQIKVNQRAYDALRREATIQARPMADLVAELVERAGWCDRDRVDADQR